MSTIWEISKAKVCFRHDNVDQDDDQGCIFRLTCSHPELTKDYVLTSVYVKIFRTVTRNAINRVSEGKKTVLDFP